MATVALRNVAGPALFDVSLLHAYYCERGGPCACRVQPLQTRTRDHRGTGKIVAGWKNHVLPSSLTIPLGVEVKGLHHAIMRLPAVQSALSAGLLRSRWEDDPAPKPAPAAPEVQETHSDATDVPPPGRSRRR